jgi:drug/metabolite transporter (DMT)-like permease
MPAHAHRHGAWPGAAFALGSALLFGSTVPFAKALLGDADPWMLAGLLYLGSGAGLALTLAVRRRPASAARLRGRDWAWLAAAILAGGVAGPVLLMFGLAEMPAASASLLLNLEGVLTALLAWLVFRENVDRRIALGMAAIVAGGVLLSGAGSFDLRFAAGPAAIAGACLAWAVDNNFTRNVSAGDPLVIAMVKGAVAGAVNVGIALALGARWPGVATLTGIALLGWLGYGVSLALFVLALRHVGTARTGAYFSTAPFVGALIAVLAFGEAFTWQLGVAGALMAAGVWLHLSERHEHEHAHEATMHEHPHVHDEHHRHDHDVSAPPGEPHSHVHEHGPLVHSHPHYPDIHHRHDH